jgi:hypothetical protein
MATEDPRDEATRILDLMEALYAPVPGMSEPTKLIVARRAWAFGAQPPEGGE